MSHKDTLYAWLKEARPEVFARIDADNVNDNAAREILNKETGLAVGMNERVEEGSRLFLEAFKAQGKAK